MSKYQLAKQCIEECCAKAGASNTDPTEQLLAILVSVIAEYRTQSGTKATLDALRYEISELGGDVDTAFLRSR